MRKWFFKILTSLWSLFDTYVLRMIPGIKQFREMQDRSQSKSRFNDVSSKLDSLKEERKEKKKQKKYDFLLKELIEKKVFNKDELINILKGDYYLLFIFAFPRLPNDLPKKLKDKCTKFFVNYLTKQKLKNKRLYSLFLEEELKFKKFGYSTSTAFYIKLENLPKQLKDKSNLNAYLKEKLLEKQKEEWNLVIKVLKKSKDREIVQFLDSFKEVDFEESYNISFYLDYLNFNKNNIFFQNENSFIIKQFIDWDSVSANKRNLVSIKHFFKNIDIDLFFNWDYPIIVKDLLIKNQSILKNSLNIESFFDDINFDDLENIFKQVLEENYDDKYVFSFLKKQKEFKNLLSEKNIILD